MKRIGVIVNPYAGLGGRSGFKGSDGVSIQEKALAMGVVPEAPRRTLACLEELRSAGDDLSVFCAPGEMGTNILSETGLSYEVVGSIPEGRRSTAEDTKHFAALMVDLGIDLLIFAGGDGTARDILDAVGTSAPVIGVPAGVKIHSAVYAINPKSAGRAAKRFLFEGGLPVADAEVMDIDEELFRQGRVEARLYGYMKVPQSEQYMQGMKAGGYSEAASLGGIAAEITSAMEPDVYYLIGPGTTTRGIMEVMGLDNTLLGVDAVYNGHQVGKDMNEQAIYDLVKGKQFRIVVTIIGGQGHLFGRGNQQLSPRILSMAGKDHITIVATRSKLVGLRGRPMVVDTGDPQVDASLRGYYKVITGYQEYSPYKLEV